MNLLPWAEILCKLSDLERPRVVGAFFGGYV